MKTRDTNKKGMETRSSSQEDLTEMGESTRAKKSFTINAAKLQNKASEKIRRAKTLATIKKSIRAHCKTQPIYKLEI